MKTIPLAAATALSLAFVSPTLAADGAASAPSAEQSDKAPVDAEAKVCRRIPVTGSRLQAKKICATPAEWRAMARATDDTIAEERKGR